MNITTIIALYCYAGYIFLIIETSITKGRFNQAMSSKLIKTFTLWTLHSLREI